MDPFLFGGLDKRLPVPRAALARNTAPKVSLANRNLIESMDAGLSSVLGMDISALHEKLTHSLTYGVW